jgi:hypothetical protein
LEVERRVVERVLRLRLLRLLQQVWMKMTRLWFGLVAVDGHHGKKSMQLAYRN